VLVSDTLLADYSTREIDAVLAHELGHHVHRDVWQLVAFEFGVGLLALRGGGWATARFGPALGLTGPSDVAALPLFALGAEAVAAVSAPIGYALSRYQERRADRFAIRLTDDPASLVSGLRRLGAQNLAEEAPSRLVELLWHTHPPLGRQLAAKRDAENSHRSDAVRTASP
jgi:STE24 endopeptidase